MQTSDPDLVTKLSEEEPADPSVMTAAQGSSAPRTPVWEQWVFCQHKAGVGGNARGPGGLFSTLQDPRKGTLHGKG